MSSLCVTIATKSVDKLRSVLEQLGLNDSTRRLKFLKEEDRVAIPIKNTVTDNVLDLEKIIYSGMKCDLKQCNIAVRKLDLPVSKKLSVKTPLQLLQAGLKILVDESGYSWTDDVQRDIPSHWEKHGDLVLFPETAFTLSLWTDIGEDVWLTVVKCLSCTRVAKKCTISVDKYRTPQVKMLYGTDTWVEHVDNGIRYSYDVTKCMFSAGNITEKLRVSKFNCEGEVVVDLYAGIGYFTLPYLVYTGVKHLHACEWNPDAVEALRRNLVLNGVADRCTVHEGDNKQVCPRGVANRVNLGLIPSSIEGWSVACAALKPGSGGMLHIHYNVNTKPLQDTESKNSHISEPPQTFRREAKNEINTFSEIDGQISQTVSGSLNCQESVNCLAGNEKVQNSGDSNLSSNHNNITCASANHSCDLREQVSYITTQQLGQVSGNNVQNSRWYKWAVSTGEAIEDILRGLHHNKWTTRIVHIEHVKSYAPYVDHIVLDLECRPYSTMLSSGN